MTKNPIYNALAALVYICVVVFVINAISGVQSDINIFIMPIMVLSLFTLSAATMGYIFCYYPIKLFLEDKKTQAVNLFIKTLAIFGLMTTSIILVYFILINTL